MTKKSSESELMGLLVLFGSVWFIFPLLWLTGRQKRATPDEYLLWTILAYVLVAFSAGWYACHDLQVVAPALLTNFLVGGFFLAFLGPRLLPKHWETGCCPG